MRFFAQSYSGHQFNSVLSGVRSTFSDNMGLQVRIEMMALATAADNATNDDHLVTGSVMDTCSMLLPTQSSPGCSGPIL